MTVLQPLKTLFQSLHCGAIEMPNHSTTSWKLLVMDPAAQSTRQHLAAIGTQPPSARPDLDSDPGPSGTARLMARAQAGPCSPFHASSRYRPPTEPSGQSAVTGYRPRAAW